MLKNNSKEYKMYLGRFFKKDIDQIIDQDIYDFISQRLEESKILEYKSVKVIDSNFGKITKTICGFANSEGGLLIIGVSEETQNSENYPKEITWYEGRMNIEAIENKIISYITPIIPDLKIKRVSNSKDEKKRIFLIEVPKSNSNPHYDNKNKNYFFRLNSQTLPMPHYLVEMAFNKRIFPDLFLNLEPKYLSTDQNYHHFRIKTILLNRGNDIANGILIQIKAPIDINLNHELKIRPSEELKNYAGIPIPKSVKCGEKFQTLILNCTQICSYPGLNIPVAILKLWLPIGVNALTPITISYEIFAKNMRKKEKFLDLHYTEKNNL
ncbi:MAG: AlbA family DNA-binding domain-containing protein [Candidatus Helarchaeota archaeon]